MKPLSFLALSLLCAAPAFAAVTVSSPANGAKVGSPFKLSASASPCSSQPISAMGYSLDTSTNTTIMKAASLSVSVTAAAGTHVLHVKSWGAGGAACTTSLTVTVALKPIGSQPITTVTVISPLYGASVKSPFALIAAGSLCSSQPISAMGYSLDDSSSSATINGQGIDALVAATDGAHILHVKSWGNNGAACSSEIAVTVESAPVPSGPSIPSNAVAIKAIQNFSIWQASYDTGTGSSATASGVTGLVATPSLSGSARKFATSYANYGGERYSVKIGADQTSTNFVYDTRIYVASPSSDIANIEMDLNQVMANGQTVIFGFQCDGWSHTWDYTENAGTASEPVDKWLHSNQSCNPQSWSTNAWHHVQVSYSRDNSGDVTYNSVWLDGVEQPLNITAFSSFALGWAPSVITNFQVDGMTSTAGSSTAYLDNVTVYSW